MVLTTLALCAILLAQQATAASFPAEEGHPRHRRAQQGQGTPQVSFALPTREEFRAQFPNNADFVFDLNGSPPARETAAGLELQYVIEAPTEGVQNAFVEENGGRGIVNAAMTGQVSLFPQGLVHSNTNLGCSRAVLLAAFNSEDPGVLTITNQALPNLPPDELAASLGITVRQLEAITNGVPKTPAEGAEACRQRCGISGGGGSGGGGSGGGSSSGGGDGQQGGGTGGGY
ncbi:hypothetical protein JKP88DRAFT_302392 [Tribonema minus]|uniref:Cupin type-1 domain-containing protein n=1 Tax=Tribonema minus TaxID=303371 RepID=A0A836CKY3_9STRA|nr:hypothetical protein JKP88DRAFT_302392 [Tribonema minus]